jgi:ribosome recycling factor
MVQVQKLHDGFVKTVEQLHAAKEKELQAQL